MANSRLAPVTHRRLRDPRARVPAPIARVVQVTIDPFWTIIATPNADASYQPYRVPHRPPGHLTRDQPSDRAQPRAHAPTDLSRRTGAADGRTARGDQPARAGPSGYRTDFRGREGRNQAGPQAA